MARPNTQVTQGHRTLGRCNGERGFCGCKRRLWLVICSQLEGEENKLFGCPSSSLPPLQRLPLPLLLEPGRRCGRGAALGDSDSSLRQQDEEDSLEEVTKAAGSSHEPVGAKAGVSIHHAFCDVCLMRREQRSSERDAQNYISHRCRLSWPHNPRHHATTAAAPLCHTVHSHKCLL